MLTLKTVSSMLYFFQFVLVQPQNPEWFGISLFDTGLRAGYKEAYEHV